MVSNINSNVNISSQKYLWFCMYKENIALNLIIIIMTVKNLYVSQSYWFWFHYSCDLEGWI